jgi:serralysin
MLWLITKCISTFDHTTQSKACIRFFQQLCEMKLSLFAFTIYILFRVGINAQSLQRGLRGLQTTGEITGPFEISAVARYDNINGFYWQRVFDFGNGPELDNIWLGQLANTADMCLEVWRDGRMYRVVAVGAIINKEAATWKVGVEANGLMWIEKNGRRLAQQPGVVPANVIRVNKFIGKSNWHWDAPLVGSVTCLQIANKMGTSNLPEINGAFVISVVARYDNFNGYFWQRVFDFGNGPALDNVWLGQLANSCDMCLEVWRDGIMYRVVAVGAIINNETVTWRVGVDASGLMWIEKNGRRLAQQQGIVPARVVRANKFIGKSNWHWDAPLLGVVESIQISSP